MKGIAAVALTSLMLAGCVTAGSVQTVPVGSSAPHKAAIAAFLLPKVRDPSSVRDAQISNQVFQLPGRPGDNAVCVKFNSKNGFGGYNGLKAYGIAMHGFSPYAIEELGDTDPDKCAVPTGPFPELMGH